MSDYVIEMLRSKALQSNCRFQVSAVAISSKGEILGSAMNSHRFSRHGGSMHAEHKLMIKYGKKISQIIIARVGCSGKFLPIDPCPNCSKMAKKIHAKIMAIR